MPGMSPQQPRRDPNAPVSGSNLTYSESVGAIQRHVEDEIAIGGDMDIGSWYATLDYIRDLDSTVRRYGVNALTCPVCRPNRLCPYHQRRYQ